MTKRAARVGQASAATALFLAAGSVGAGLMILYPAWRYGDSLGTTAAGIIIASAWAGLIWAMGRVRGRTLIAVTLIFGVALRVASTLLTAGSAPVNDPLSYTTLAQALLDGHGLIAWGVRAHYPPLYPLVLAGFAWGSGSISLAALVINIVADGCAASLLWRIAARSLVKRHAATAGAICFLWPALLVDGAVVQKESLTLAIALAAILAAVRCFEEPWQAWRAAVLGVTWGLLGLCQPALVTMPPIMCLGLAIHRSQWRPVPRMIGAAALAFAFTMAPWWLRNFALFGQFVPFTTAGGLMFLGPLSDQVILGGAGAPASEARYAAWTIRNALNAIAANPVSYIAHALFHGGRAMLLDVGAAEQFFSFQPVRTPGLIVTLMTACQASWCLLWAFAAAGARKASRLNVALLGGVLVEFAAVNMWLHFHERHRLVLMPLLIAVAMSASTAAGRTRPAADCD